MYSIAGRLGDLEPNTDEVHRLSGGVDEQLVDFENRGSDCS